MAPDSHDAALLHFADMHFEDDGVFGPNYDSLESYREHAYDQLDELAADADYAWFSGDCGTEEDWRELEGFLDRFEDAVTVPGNSDQRDDSDYLEHDEVDELERLITNAERSELQVTDDISYDVLHSHDPRHVGVPPGDWEDRTTYIDDETNDRGVAHAQRSEQDIVVTAHKHGEGSFVMEDGTLAIQAGSTAQNYITSDILPTTSVQKIYFDDNEVRVRHIDFGTGEVVEERGYRFNGDGFEEICNESPWGREQRYGD